MTYYFAYGMNTNVQGMRKRCPDATSCGYAVLENFKFRFAYHADIVPEVGNQVHGVLWHITEQCLKNLDNLEGYPIYYDRIIVPIQYKGITVYSYVYLMQPGHVNSKPAEGYLNMVLEGYESHNVSDDQIFKALSDCKIFDK